MAMEYSLCSAYLVLFLLIVVECRIEIRTMVKGNGVDIPRDNDTVVVHYTGSLVDGRVFDSSRSPGRTPFEFVIGQGTVINGWDVGFKHLSLGQRAQLIITYDDAYGATGMMSSTPPIYPFATLLFDVELLQIKRPQQVSMPFNNFQQQGFNTQAQQQAVGTASQQSVGTQGTGTQFQTQGTGFGSQPAQIQQTGQFGGQIPAQASGQLTSQVGTQQNMFQQGTPTAQGQPLGMQQAAAAQFQQSQAQFGTSQQSVQGQFGPQAGQQFGVQPQTAGQASGQAGQSQQLGVQQGFGVQPGQPIGFSQG